MLKTFIFQYFYRLTISADIKHTAIRLCTARSGTSKLNAVRVDAPTQAKASMALRATIISSRIAGRCRIRRRSFTHRGTWTFSLGEALAPFRSAYENVTENMSQQQASSTCVSYFISIKKIICIQFLPVRIATIQKWFQTRFILVMFQTIQLGE